MSDANKVSVPELEALRMEGDVERKVHVAGLFGQQNAR